MNARAFLALASAAATVMSAAPTPAQEEDGGAPRLALTSPAFTNGGPIPARYTCDGEAASPPLTWSAVPAVAKTSRSSSRIRTLQRAPSSTGSSTTCRPGRPGSPTAPPGAKRSPAPTRAPTARAETGWSPLCPPWGRHHYHFRVYALRDALVVAHPTLAELERAMNGLIVAEDETVGTYERSGK